MAIVDGRGRRAARVGAVLLAGLVGFYVLPVDPDDPAVVPRVIACALALSGLAWLFVSAFVSVLSARVRRTVERRRGDASLPNSVRAHNFYAQRL